MKQVALAEVKDHLSQYLHKVEKEQIVITKYDKPAGVLIDFETEDDWFEYKLENDPRFLKRIAAARASFKSGKGIPWKKTEAEEKQQTKHSRNYNNPRR